MNIFRIDRLPLFQGPDMAPGATPPVDPAVVSASDPANPPPAPVADPPAPVVADPPADPAPSEHGNKGRSPWYMGRISELTHRAQTVEQERDHYKAIAERTKPGGDPAPAPQPATSDEAEVERRVQAQLAQRQISGVITEGIKKFADWDERAAILGSAGAASPDFVMDVIGVHPNNAHEILHQLSEDPEKASRLARLDQRSRIIELARMNAAAPIAAEPPKPAAPPKAPSRAPTPPPALEPGSSQSIDWRSDKASDQDFSKGWEENQAKRRSRR